MTHTHKSLYSSAALIWMLLGLFCLSLAVGCTKGLDQDSSAAGDDQLPELKLTAISPTTTDTINGLELSIVNAEGGFDVTIVAGAGIQDLHDLFFSVDYSASELHSTGLPAAPLSSSDEVLGLVAEPVTGHIEVGMVAIAQATVPAVRAGDTLLAFKLVRGTAERQASEVASNARARARNLELVNADDHWTLSWDYTNPGDANQDGEVGIGDLTPIGAHFMESVANTWEDPLRHIDGDNNGEINAGDITPIGQNYSAEIFAYQIEMCEDGSASFRTVGQLVLDEARGAPGETVRFTYEFGAEFVDGAWYRVVTLDRDLAFGIPSEAISSNGRRLDPINVEPGQEVSVTLYANNLPAALAHMNAVRVVFPATFEYVRGSANPGSLGGSTCDVDGIWSSFVQPSGLLFPPDSFFVTTDLGNGRCALDLNVTSIDRIIPAAPIGYGDLINFKLQNNGSAPLELEFQPVSTDDVKRTYFSDSSNGDHFFGNSIGFRVNQ